MSDIEVRESIIIDKDDYVLDDTISDEQKDKVDNISQVIKRSVEKIERSTIHLMQINQDFVKINKRVDNIEV